MKGNRVKNLILKNISLKELTSIKIGGIARFFAEPKTIEELLELIEWSKKNGIPYIVLGGGTNCIFQDGVLEKLVISMRKFKYLEIKENIVVAGAGVLTGEFLRKTEIEGLYGLEFCIGIPATIGGMVFMNFGAFGSQIFDFLKSIICIENGKVQLKKKEDVSYSYRKGYQDGIILVAEIELKRNDIQKIREIKREFMIKRKSMHPLNIPSSGCIFKNPPNCPAGKLIDSAGLKGLRLGDAEVSALHANFIVNRGNAKFNEVLGLIQKIKDTVYEKFQIKLKEEVRLIKNGRI